MTTKERITQSLRKSVNAFDVDIVEPLIIHYLSNHPSAVINVDIDDEKFDTYSNDKWMNMTIPALWAEDFIEFLDKSKLYFRIGYNSRIPIRIQYTPIY